MPPTADGNFRCEVLLDSLNVATDDRLTTFTLCYEYDLVHADFMTYREFSRNASGSRAIPFERLLAWVDRDPAVPLRFCKARPGMVGAVADGAFEADCRSAWLRGYDAARAAALNLHSLGCQKEACNRMVQPYSWINVLVSATNYHQFFAQRCRWDANPNIQRLAVRMARAYRASVPTPLEPGRWHLPYVRPEDRDDARRAWLDPGPRGLEVKLAYLAAGRARRVSLRSHADNVVPALERDVDRGFECGRDRHWTPLEHAARAGTLVDESARFWGNYSGWEQFRKMQPGERRGPESEYDSLGRACVPFDFGVLDRCYPAGLDYRADWPADEP
jgi:hypothetical protein